MPRFLSAPVRFLSPALTETLPAPPVLQDQLRELRTAQPLSRVRLASSESGRQEITSVDPSSIL